MTRLLAAGLLVGCGGPAIHPAPSPATPVPSRPMAAASRPAAAVPAAPERSSGWRSGVQAVTAARQMVVAAHPLAAQAGLAALRAGGSAADGALAVQMVLGLVEPQSSGPGGGAFIVVHEAGSGRLTTWDGRETAPAAASENDLRWVGDDERTPPRPDPRASGRSIGVPGVLRALEALHRAHGRLPWARGFDAAIALAEDGFPIPARMADAIATHRAELLRDPDAAALFLHPDGSPRRAGERLRNPAYARTMRALARHGADAFYAGAIADAIVDEVARTAAGPSAPGELTPGRMTRQDLARYRAIAREPVCGAYRAWWVCGMGPPSSGGIAVAQVLGILQGSDLAARSPQPTEVGEPTLDPTATHWLVEAERLAFADRNRYVADPAFVPLPARGAASLLDPAYLRSRAALIQDGRSLGVAPPGRFDDLARGDSAQEGHGTSQVSIVDAQGLAVSMTTTIESSLGAWRVVEGFVLNNELTDFSAEPADASGPIANRLQGGKRPRSSMAPTMVFERRPDGGRGDLVLLTGSPGGAAIIPFVAKTLVGLLDWGLDAQQAAALPNVAAFNTPATVLGREHPALAMPGPLDAALAGRGHTVVRVPLTSGVATIRRDRRGAHWVWQGGVDPRREGQALGD